MTRAASSPFYPEVLVSVSQSKGEKGRRAFNIIPQFILINICISTMHNVTTCSITVYVITLHGVVTLLSYSNANETLNFIIFI
jgi:hypothetical protein